MCYHQLDSLTLSICQHRSDAVESLGFGIGSDRVIPCIRIYTKESKDKWDLLKKEVAMYITDAAKETDNVLLSPEDCLRCLEVDNFNNSIIYPEELMGFPGEQFKVSPGVVKGTIGCYLKAELKLGIQGRTICFTKHFALTCAHCVIPVNIITRLVHDACNDDGIQKKIQQYPLTDLYNYMWKHSLYQGMLQYPHDHQSQRQQSNPDAYDGFSFDQELCMIQGALCFEEMRALINEKLKYDDYEYETRSQHVQTYNYVCSKYGMIPQHFHLPLPHYIFKNVSNTGQVDFHLPFNIDIGVLEITEGMPQLDYTHCIGASYHYMSKIGEFPSKPMAIDNAPSVLRCKELRESQFRKEMSHITPSQLSEYSKPYGLVDPKTAYSKEDSVTLSEGYTSLTISPNPSNSTGNGAPTTHCKPDCTTLSVPDPPFLRSISKDSDCEESLSSPVIDTVLGHQTIGSTTQKLLTTEPPIVRDHIYSPAQKNTLKTAVKKNISKASSGILALGRRIFGVKEEKKLRLHVMSHQAYKDSRPARRTLEVNNKDFCLELVHRNPKNRQQKRSFPTIKWKSQDNHFIKPGDSGSSLFVIVKDENGLDKLVLLGIAGSATTASRIDFTKEVLAPDLFLYMSSELRKYLPNFPNSNNFLSFCETVENHVQIDNQLSKLASPTDDNLISPEYAHLTKLSTIPERKEQLCHDIQEKSRLLKKMEKSVKFPFSSSPLAAATEGHVSFKLTECIEDCASSYYDQHDGPIVELGPEMWEQLWS